LAVSCTVVGGVPEITDRVAWANDAAKVIKQPHANPV
jgi:hypothetical protein